MVLEPNTVVYILSLIYYKKKLAVIYSHLLYIYSLTLQSAKLQIIDETIT